jgi:hypothetical protein
MKRAKINNSGSTFIIVIVAVSFMMVLGTIMLAATAANVTSKQIEYAAKQSFYTDERVLDDIYHGIGRVADEYLTLAYSEVLGKVSSSADDGYSNQLQAFGAFADSFVTRLAARYGANGVWDDPGNATLAATYAATLDSLNSYINVTNNPSETDVRVTKFDSIEIVYDRTLPILEFNALTGRWDIKDANFATAPDATNAHPFQYVFRGVEVHYVVMVETSPGVWYNPGYESVITTDIAIEVPYIQFFQATSSIFDYALVGVEGLYFGNGTQTVTGNVYAGVTDRAPVSGYDQPELPGGLNLRNGARTTFNSSILVSKGDINVNPNAVLNAKGITEPQNMELWAESLRVVDGLATVNITGQMYIANDLEINGDGSAKYVNLTGAYFGYSDLGYRSFESYVGKNGTSKYKLKPGATASDIDGYFDEHTRSSAIIINGKNAKLNLTNLDILVVAGLAYVDLRNAPADTNVEEFPTGESIALKSSQYMYLAPSDWLNYPNPYLWDSATDPPGAWQSQPGPGFWAVDTSGVSMLAAGNVVPRRAVNNGDTYLYYFLNLKDSSRKAFAELVLNMKYSYVGAPAAPYDDSAYDDFRQDISNVKHQVNERFFSSGNEITYSDATYFYTAGTMTRTTGDADRIEAYDPPNKLSEAEYIKTITSLQVGSGSSATLEPGSLEHLYIYLYEELDPKNSYARANTTLPAPSPVTLTENLGGTSNYRYPMGKYVHINDGGLRDAAAVTTTYRDNPYTTIISGGAGSVDITGEVSGIVLAYGDVYVRSGAKFSGLILSAGRIFVDSNATITANRAAIQAIIDEEIREESKRPAGSDANAGYAITYLKDIEINRTGFDMTERIDSADYTSYISYARWRKGQVDL